MLLILIDSALSSSQAVSIFRQRKLFRASLRQFCLVASNGLAVREREREQEMLDLLRLIDARFGNGVKNGKLANYGGRNIETTRFFQVSWGFVLNRVPVDGFWLDDGKLKFVHWRNHLKEISSRAQGRSSELCHERNPWARNHWTQFLPTFSNPARKIITNNLLTSIALESWRTYSDNAEAYSAHTLAF